jgi:hypothetical protein
VRRAGGQHELAGRRQRGFQRCRCEQLRRFHWGQFQRRIWRSFEYERLRRDFVEQLWKRCVLGLLDWIWNQHRFKQQFGEFRQ